MDILTGSVARDAVRAYMDGRTFTPEVVAMLKDSFAEKDSAVSFHQSHMHLYNYANCSVYTFLQA